MKSRRFSPALVASLALLSAVSFPAVARANIIDTLLGRNLFMTVVAERTKPGESMPMPNPTRPATYVAYDGGYVEAGNPEAGQRPPAPPVVAAYLQQALAVGNYQPAATGATPTLLITYHWGVLNRDTFQIGDAFHLQPNLRARIELVSSPRQARDLEQYILDHRIQRLQQVDIPQILPPDEQDALQDARDAHYFIIVSAYDYAALTRGQATLLWRVRLSTRSAGSAMTAALPAMLEAGAPYFGRNLDQPKHLEVANKAPAPAAVAPMPAPSPAVSSELAQPFVQKMVHDEGIQLTGMVGK